MALHLLTTRNVRTCCVLGRIVLAAGCGPGNDPAKLDASAKDFIAKKDSPAGGVQLKDALQLLLSD